MLDSKAIPNGLKDHECKKGMPNRPPIPYVPDMDKVQEIVQECCKQYFKIKLEDKTKFSIAIWDAGTNKVFLNHILSALNTYDSQGYFDSYIKALAMICKDHNRSKELTSAVIMAEKSMEEEERPNRKEELEAKAQKLCKTLMQSTHQG